MYDHPAVQRLRRVAQLGGANHVFPAAEHSRFPHVLGTLQAATLLMDSMDANIAADSRKSYPMSSWRLGRQFTEEERVFVRLAALIHDVGHLPYGHTLEDELGLLRGHDSLERMRLVARMESYRPLSQERPRMSEVSERLLVGWPLETLLERTYGSVRSKVVRRSVKVLDLVLELTAKDARVQPGRYDEGRFRVGLCRELLVGPVSADVIDYLRRDQHSSGIEAGSYNPRLLQYLLPCIPPGENTGESAARIVVDLGYQRRYKKDAATAVAALLGSRFEMTQVVYRHPAKSSSAAMLDRVLGHFATTGVLAEIDLAEVERLSCSEYADEDGMLRLVDDVIRRRLATSPQLDDETMLEHEQVLELLDLIVLRRLHKTEFSLSPSYEPDRFRNAVKLFSGPSGATPRTAFARRLEADFGLVPGDVVIYSSGVKPGHKDPNLWLRLDGDAFPVIQEGRADEEKADPSVEAIIDVYFRSQQQRFESLERFEVLLSNAAISQLKGMRANQAFRDVALLALKRWSSSDEEHWRDLRARVARARGLELGTYREYDTAARSRSTPWARYASGMPALFPNGA
ncbi:HD domain-containing protein [Ornithinimicrobium sp. CNJ-824]|uniref:HD domain-containing protein n=1 Tax=Ornithinimicrobium sp. CNJ-824 TaxID=1904966 RepID=UPI001180496F|nr:HD domain-containing protein [Ornithinimicrobium sp. CNJ-824]